MTPYIVKDMVASGKQVSATDGINASKELMKGHKMALFIFDKFPRLEHFGRHNLRNWLFMGYSILPNC